MLFSEGEVRSGYYYYYYYYKCQDLSDAITTVAGELYKVYQ